MPETDPTWSPAPESAAAAAEEPTADQANPAFMDLSKASPWTRNVVEPQFAIRSTSAVGYGSVRAAEEIVKAATEQNLAAPQPAALAIYQDPTNPRVLYGIPVMKQSPSFLSLLWFKNRKVRANFRAVLQLKEIVIPPGSRMLIEVEKINHPVHKHCVKLSWAEDCFTPIHDRTSASNKTTTE
ncbi:MAG: hypothetical protein ACOY94_04505 [Bacillota bacterium]